MGITIRYTSPSGAIVTFTEGAPRVGAFTLLAYEGLDGNLTSPITQKSPFQVGQSLLATTVESRIISLTALVYGQTDSQLHTMIKTLASTLSIAPGRMGQKQQLGKLEVSLVRNNATHTYEIDCIPQESPQFTGEDGQGIRYADMEFFCPYPYWRSKTVRTSAFTPAGTDLIVQNDGDIPIPCILNIKGNVTDPTVRHVNTGDTITFKAVIPANQTLAIHSHVGAKKATLGVQNMLSKIDFATSTFIMLSPGTNTLRLSSPGGNYGTFQIISQDEFSGIGA